MPSLRLALPLALLPTLAPHDAAAGEPIIFLSGGYTYTVVGGSAPGHGHGLELTAPIFVDDADGAGIAPLLQARWLDSGEPASWTVGGELIGPFIGLELGYSSRYYDGVHRAGIHVGPFVSAFGLFNVAGRFVAPIDDGAGEYGVTFSLKIPLPVHGQFNFVGAPHGRPLKVAGEAARAQVRWGAARAAAQGLAPRARWALAQAWLEDAQMEHASVANFRLLADQLAGLGAPEALIREARRAADDEADHARRCLSIAGALAGRAVTLGDLDGPLATAQRRRPSLTDVAVESVVDGLIGEGRAFREIEQAAWAAEGPVAAHMHTIAADEARHSRLSGHIARWAMAAGGAPVKAAVAAAVRAQPQRLPQLRSEPEGATAVAWGRPQPRHQLDAFGAALAGIHSELGPGRL